MNLTSLQLKHKWNKERESYTKKEVGDGVQKFVKDFIKSPDFFGLKDGLNSTLTEKRKNEFTEESKTKAARKADIIIYINSDIVIPVEVEKYQDIENGFEQLMQYQTDLDKKYGILTDGYLWRFYNNAYLLKEFTLDQIFYQPDLFNDFWQEYIKVEFYYLSFFEEKGQLKMLPEDLSAEKRRQDFFRDITTLIRSFKNKLEIEGYFKNLEEKERKKKAVEIAYAYIIQFILYKTLVDNDFDDFAGEFKKRTKEIYECLKEKNYGKILGIIGGISDTISKDIYRPFEKEQQFINDTLLNLFHKPKNYLHDVSPWLDIFVFIKNYSFANVKNEIFGYIYENYLKELYEDAKKGQYFTDPAVVNFMLDQVGYTPETIEKRLESKPEENGISVIDPSCGSGTFLYSATDRIIESVPDGSEESSKKIEEIVNYNVFGLDIAEFPLYLAEMNILMRMLPLIVNKKYNNPIDKKIKVFKTSDSIVEFMDTAIRNTMHDIAGQQSLFSSKKIDLGYSSFMREQGDLEEMKKSLETHPKAPRRRFDFVIGNPPYVSYNECSKQGVSVFNLMKDGKVKLNDIYGVNLHSTPINQKKYAPKPNLYTFFIALGVALLKDYGKLCYIIPQTILTAGDLDVIRYYLAKNTTIEKIITFSGNMFIGRGLKQNKEVATSSLVFVIRREMPSVLHQVEVIYYKDSNDEVKKCLENISAGKKIIKKKIKQQDFLVNLSNWNFIKQNKVFLDFYQIYKTNSNDISAYYDHKRADSRFGSRFYFDIGFSLDPRKIISSDVNKSELTYELLDFKNFNGFSRYLSNEYYPRDKKNINLTQNSQGYITLDQDYKIVWSIKNPDKFYFTNHPIIFYMGKASIICSNNKKELFYIFSILNSFITKNVLLENLKSENEKDYLVPIKSIKELVRIPKITSNNQFIKDEIVARTEEMLALEDVSLSDLVDFSGVMMQKISGVDMRGDSIVLIKGEKEIKCRIKKDTGLVKTILKNKFESKELLNKKEIALSDLKSMPAVDLEKQGKLRDYIDDLVFTLYFNMPIKKIGIEKAVEIKKECEVNKFYKILNKK